MLFGLLIGWILSLFKFDDLFIKGFQELFGKSISIAGYYVCFFFIGVLWDLGKYLRGGEK